MADLTEGRLKMQEASGARVEVSYKLKAGAALVPIISAVSYDIDGTPGDFATATKPESAGVTYTALDGEKSGAVLRFTTANMKPVTFVLVSAPGGETLETVESTNWKIDVEWGNGDIKHASALDAAALTKAGSAILLAIYREKTVIVNTQAWGLHGINATTGLTNPHEIVHHRMKSAGTIYPTAYPPAEGSTESKDERTSPAERDWILEHGLHERYVTVGITWDRASGVDLDLSCVVTRRFGSPRDMVYFNKLSDDCAFMRHSGDQRQGESDFRYGAGNGDDEQIVVDMKTLLGYERGLLSLHEIKNLSFFVTAYNGVINKDTKLVAYMTNGTQERFRLEFDTFPASVGRVTGIWLCTLAIWTPRSNNHGSAYGVDQVLGFCFEGNVQGLPKLCETFAQLFNPLDSRDKYIQFPNHTGTPRSLVHYDAKEPFNNVRAPIRTARAPAPARPEGFVAPAKPAADVPVDVATQANLHIAVHSGFGLIDADSDGSSDPYVVVSMPHGKNKKKVQTTVVKKSLSPVWDEYLVLPGPFAPEDVLVFEVLDKDLIGSDKMGQVSVAVSDIWKMKGPQMLAVGGQASKERPGQGHIFVSLDWQNLAAGTPQPKFNE